MFDLNKNIITFALIIISVFAFVIPAISNDKDDTVQQRIETTPEDIPNFNRPVALLIGINSSELAYNEISSLAGFELFSVPYRSDLKTLITSINPTQIVIKHPSGFVGLYSTDGQLIRGVKTLNNGEIKIQANSIPPSIIEPTEAISSYPSLIHTGSLTGTVPHGGLGYTPPPKGRGVLRHLLKLGTLTGLVPFQYPGYFNAYSTTDTEKLFPSLVLPQLPLAIGAAATIVDSKLDESEYEYARTQPRDYKFQPEIEGY